MEKENFTTITSFSLNENLNISEEAVKTLNQDGVVCLRQAFPKQWLNVIEQGIESALAGASTDVNTVKRKNDVGSFSFSSGAWMQVEPFRHFIFDSHLADIARTLLETQQLVLFYDFLLVKEALSNNAATPWHQDHSYYPLDGTKAINCWIALDDIPVESALQFMKGSHRPATLYRAVDFDNPEIDYRHARKELPLPPDDHQDFPTEILTTAVCAGDMLIWYSYTLHSAPGNQLDRRRAAFSVNWLGDDIVYNNKPSLETYRDPGLKIGQPMNCDKFPLVRSEQRN